MTLQRNADGKEYKFKSLSTDYNEKKDVPVTTPLTKHTDN